MQVLSCPSWAVVPDHSLAWSAGQILRECDPQETLYSSNRIWLSHCSASLFAPDDLVSDLSCLVADRSDPDLIARSKCSIPLVICCNRTQPLVRSSNQYCTVLFSHQNSIKYLQPMCYRKAAIHPAQGQTAVLSQINTHSASPPHQSERLSAVSFQSWLLAGPRAHPLGEWHQSVGPGTDSGKRSLSGCGAARSHSAL